MMMGDWRVDLWMRNRKSAKFRRPFVPEMWCSVRYGAVGELEMSIVTGGRERVRTKDDRVERVGWTVKRSRRYLDWE